MRRRKWHLCLALLAPTAGRVGAQTQSTIHVTVWATTDIHTTITSTSTRQIWQITPPTLPTNTDDFPLYTFTDVWDLAGSKVVPDLSIIDAEGDESSITAMTYTAMCAGATICDWLWIYTFTQAPGLVAWQFPQVLSWDGQIVVSAGTAFSDYKSSIAYWSERCTWPSTAENNLGTCTGSFLPLTFSLASPIATPTTWGPNTAQLPFVVAAARITAGMERLGFSAQTMTLPVSTLTRPAEVISSSCSLAQGGAGPPYLACLDVETYDLGTTTWLTSYPCTSVSVSGQRSLSCGSIYWSISTITASASVTLSQPTSSSAPPMVPSRTSSQLALFTSCTGSISGNVTVLVCHQPSTTATMTSDGVTRTLTLEPSTTSETVFPRLTNFGYGFTYVAKETKASLAGTFHPSALVLGVGVVLVVVVCEGLF